jgi:hypothetical protein
MISRWRSHEKRPESWIPAFCFTKWLRGPGSHRSLGFFLSPRRSMMPVDVDTTWGIVAHKKYLGIRAIITCCVQTSEALNNTMQQTRQSDADIRAHDH